jgi:hypothetical protein
MYLKEQLLIENSSLNKDYIANYIGNNTILFDNLIDLIFKGSPPVPLRASWVVCAVTDKYPHLLSPYMTRIVEHLTNFKHNGIHRNLLRQISKVEIPEELLGILYDICNKWLLSKTEPPAVKVHCMQVLFNISEREPDLKPELSLIIEQFIDNDSAALRSRSRSLFRILSKK